MDKDKKVSTSQLLEALRVGDRACRNAVMVAIVLGLIIYWGIEALVG